MLCAFVVLLVAMQALSIDASLAPGLSFKNLGLYVLASLLLLRFVVGGELKGGSRLMQVAFLLLCAYATVSWLLVAMALNLPGYEPLQAFVRLKSEFYDQAIFFLVFFYGVQSADDAIAVLDALLCSAVFAHILTVIDSFGLIHVISERTDIADAGRSQGAFGESNIHGAVVVLLLPAVLARMLEARSFAKVAWGLGAIACAASLFLVASRGAMLGIGLGSIWGAYLFRRIVSPATVARWTALVTIVTSIGILVIGATYTDLLRERLLDRTFTGDLTSASAGRTAVWSDAISRMLESPWTLLIGFGHDVYGTMDFEYAPHNTYLGLWFNLGLPGLLAFIAIIAAGVLTARSGAESARPGEIRAQLIAYVIGFLALAVAVFFVELHTAWMFVWAYTGLAMRLSAEVQQRAGAGERRPGPRAAAVAKRVVRTRETPGRA
jgi:O-antigen ligase